MKLEHDESLLINYDTLCPISIFGHTDIVIKSYYLTTKAFIYEHAADAELDI